MNHFLVSAEIFLLLLVFWSGLNQLKEAHAAHDEKLLVVAVIKRESSGYRRFLRSARATGLAVKTLGLDGYWDGDGHKVTKLKEELERYKHDNQQVILFANGPDALLSAGADQILEKFKKFNSKIVFSAEKSCWPEWTMSSRYPETNFTQKFLNSGLFIGYAPELYRVVASSYVEPYLNDQLFYTVIYVNEGQRKEFNISLDHKSELFLNLYKSTEDVALRFDENEVYALYQAHNTRPIAFHSNGLTQQFLNYLSNYILNAWTPHKGCVACLEDTKSLTMLQEENYPVVVMALFIETPTTSLDEFFLRIYDLNYPKGKIRLIIRNTVHYHNDLVDGFAEDHVDEYQSIQIIGPENKMKGWRVKDFVVEECVAIKCDYMFSVDSNVRLTNPEVLQQLIEQNRTVIAPMLVLSGNSSVVNFWGSVRQDGSRDPSIDYLDVTLNNHRGLWNVPYVNSCVLVRGDVILNQTTKPFYIQVPHLAFCAGMRNRHVDMYVSNREDWGHLISTDNFVQEAQPKAYRLAYKPTGKVKVTRGDLLFDMVSSLGLYFVAGVILLAIYNMLRKHLLCNSRIMRITLSRNVSNIWNGDR